MWPRGVSCAVNITFDLDAEFATLDQRELRDRPGEMSQGRYGPLVGVPLILEIMDRHSVPGTFFVPGMVAERYPETVKSILEAGHEIANHGYSHSPLHTLSRDQETAELAKAREILEGFGAEVIGFRAPWELSRNTLGILEKERYLYSSNLMDSIVPYLHTETHIIELPIQWLTEDWAHFGYGGNVLTKKIATNSEVYEIWSDEFEGIYELEGYFNLNLHPQVIGRPSRLRLLGDFLAYMQEFEGVWIATCNEVAHNCYSALRNAE